jgi:hypothetical protein
MNVNVNMPSESEYESAILICNVESEHANQWLDVNSLLDRDLNMTLKLA